MVSIWKMRSKNEHKVTAETSDQRELRLLSEIDRTPEVSQRDLSQRIGVALGLTNIVLRNLTQKGYVRISKAGWKRWIYLLTPDGVTRKLQLMTGYIHRVMDQYREVRETLREQLIPLALHSESRIAIYGTGDFAELVYLGLKEHRIEEIDIFEAISVEGAVFLGIPVHEIGSIQANQYDKIIVGSIGDGEEACALLSAHGAERQQLVTFFS